jgi:hypothetical protein
MKFTLYFTNSWRLEAPYGITKHHAESHSITRHVEPSQGVLWQKTEFVPLLPVIERFINDQLTLSEAGPVCKLLCMSAALLATSDVADGMEHLICHIWPSVFMNRVRYSL